MTNQLTTTHQIIIGDSAKMDNVASDSIDLVVTSPPYPMIEMWDGVFSTQNPIVSEALSTNGNVAFELMHKELDKVWTELKRVVKEGGIVCINIGDATRTINGNFAIYPNHARILTKMIELGFVALPEILWHKPTNAPNKYMGSGMLPGGAYVTLEHEHILIFRKNNKKPLSLNEKIIRKESAYFWEERNEWFSDVWRIIGSRQMTPKGSTRERSAAYPFEIPKRLVLMYSKYGDTVLDPFIGTGTTTKVAVTLGRNSIGYDIDNSIAKNCFDEILNAKEELGRVVSKRMKAHIGFVTDSEKAGNILKHSSTNYGFPVKTKQETDILFWTPVAFKIVNDELIVNYIIATNNE